MQTIANENVQDLSNYANKSAADTNATETLKDHIVEIKSAHTAANEKSSNLTGQVGDTRQYYPSNNNRQGGWYNKRRDQYKGQNHQQGGRGGRGNRRGNNGNTGKGYIQPKSIIKYG